MVGDNIRSNTSQVSIHSHISPLLDMKCHEISFSPSVDHSIVKAELRLGVTMARLDTATWRGRPRYVVRTCVEAGNKCVLLGKRAIRTREEVIKVPIEVGKLRKYVKIRVRVRDRRRRQWVDCNQWPFVHSNNKDKYTALLLIYREASSSSNFFRNLFG